MDKTPPKKRGRKPKKNDTNITESNTTPNPVVITTDIIPQKKKRGRKPKPKPENEVVKIPKKRGRKPKEIFKPTEPVATPITEEAVILHLNIKNKHSSVLNIEDEFVKYNPEINIPIPFIPEDLNNAFYLDKQTNCNSGSLQANVTNEDDNEQLQVQPSPHQTESKDNQNSIDIQTNVKMNISNNDIYEKFNKKNDEYQEEFTSDKNKCLPIFVEFSEANKRNEWPSKTNIDCFWCCHAFDNSPFGIPIKKVGNVFHMFGNFCSAECVASYIFDTNLLNDCKKTECYSMLNLLYKENNSDGISFAPSKLCLKRFGGRLSIEQYRSNLRSQNKSYSIIIPPLMSIIPNVEETNIIKNFNDIGKSILNDSIVSRRGELLRLRRTKPLPDSNNTLEACMNLKLL